MAWEPRGNGRYYYGKERHGKQVVSVYYGKGPLAHAFEAVVEARKLKREALSLKSLRLRERLQRRAQAIETDIQPLFDAVEEVFHSAMNVAGFHRHHRQWRRRRGGRMDLDSSDVPLDPAATRPAEVRLLFGPVNRMRIEGRRTDMSREVERLLLRACSSDPLQRECIRRDVAQRRAELAGESPTVIETMLADRVALCWLDVQVADRESRVFIGSESRGTTDRDYFQRRVDRAQRRFLAAARALAHLRKLALPAVFDIVNRDSLRRKTSQGIGAR